MSASKSLGQDHINSPLNFLRINQIVAEEKCRRSIEGYVKKSLCFFFFFFKVIFIRKPQGDNFELA